MVIPVVNEKPSTQNELKKYIGNNMRIHLSENTKSLCITGSNSRVKIDKNQGNLKIVGDNCKVNVASGSGKISYVGNNGKFHFGSSEMSDVFEYSGCNISVTTGFKSGDIQEKLVNTKKAVVNFGEKIPGTSIHISNTNNVRISSAGTVFKNFIPKK
ncbi:hypothetical protein WA026_021845 [Henosepilachna vigintioctopunctata]|uniref:Adhesin domain-containing protein n=1 Tax=Henosepilachna vigintioctopunctata TaxID=420089 RepID=A0AAW1UPP1_9CUCU